MHNLLNVNDLKPDDIEAIFNLAQSIHRGHGHSLRVPKIMATLFFEPSTRTKLSFQAAMYKLGGQVIDLPTESSQKKGETEVDTIKTISRYADVLVIRHPSSGIMESFAPFSNKPIINAGDGYNEHPTQALIDLYTIRQYKADKKNLSIMFTGDCYYSRVIPSLINILKKEKCEYRIIFSNEVAPWLIDRDDKRLIYSDESTIEDNLSKIDILYMTRSQKERTANPIKTNFILTKELTYKMKADAIIMHPLPRNDEIHPDVDENYRAKYFQQVENGLYVRMAILYYIL